MPAMNPSGDAMSVVIVEFSPEPATDITGVRRNIDRIGAYVDRACNSFPGVDLIVFPEYSTHGFAFNPDATSSGPRIYDSRAGNRAVRAQGKGKGGLALCFRGRTS